MNLLEELNIIVVGYVKLKKKKSVFSASALEGPRRELERDQVWKWEMEFCFEESIYLRLLCF